jgi:hypothetical protein
MTRTDPCMDRGPTSAVSVAGYWHLAADTCNMNRYERDMCMYVSAQICGGDTNRYEQIWTYLNSEKGPISGEIVYITSIYVHILCISGAYPFKSRGYHVYMVKYQLLRGLGPQNLNRICTDINDMNRYEQICVCLYLLIFLQFIWSDKVHHKDI